jgi:predicted RNA-binding protein YlxR (DUF448 family)
MKEKHELVRVAASANGEITIGDKVPGRGAYICRNETCIKKAHKIKGLERSLKRPVPLEIYEKAQVAKCLRFVFTN